ncbi:MAG: GHMP kinase [Chloroflexi bacterium]|nr:GHMP kinase [Chloroflexota bacterium]
MTVPGAQKPLRIINSAAPIRVCDNGGWTDTWFAAHGKVFNIGVYPYAEVQIEVYPYQHDHAERIVIYAENYGERYVPATSAAVAVALIGALDCLTPGRLSAHEVAYTAHSVEVDMLKRQSGIQDQLCSAYGGINYIEMRAYPHATVSQLQLPNAIWWELERRLALIYLGNSHDSSQVHDKVIAQLAGAGPDCPQIADLRQTAERSRDALCDGDFGGLGRAMIENTEAQGRLDPDLISPDAWRIIEIAKAHGALGWKVNGAGGAGGSLTILASDRTHEKRAMLRAMESESRLFKNIPIHLSRHGLRVWEQG